MERRPVHKVEGKTDQTVTRYVWHGRKDFSLPQPSRIHQTRGEVQQEASERAMRPSSTQDNTQNERTLNSTCGKAFTHSASGEFKTINNNISSNSTRHVDDNETPSQDVNKNISTNKFDSCLRKIEDLHGKLREAGSVDEDKSIELSRQTHKTTSNEVSGVKKRSSKRNGEPVVKGRFHMFRTVDTTRSPHYSERSAFPSHVQEDCGRITASENSPQGESNEKENDKPVANEKSNIQNGRRAPSPYDNIRRNQQVDEYEMNNADAGMKRTSSQDSGLGEGALPSPSDIVLQYPSYIIVDDASPSFCKPKEQTNQSREDVLEMKVANVNYNPKDDLEAAFAGLERAYNEKCAADELQRKKKDLSKRDDRKTAINHPEASPFQFSESHMRHREIRPTPCTVEKAIHTECSIPPKENEIFVRQGFEEKKNFKVVRDDPKTKYSGDESLVGNGSSHQEYCSTKKDHDTALPNSYFEPPCTVPNDTEMISQRFGSDINKTEKAVSSKGARPRKPKTQSGAEAKGERKQGRRNEVRSQRSRHEVSNSACSETFVRRRQDGNILDFYIKLMLDEERSMDELLREMSSKSPTPHAEITNDTNNPEITRRNIVTEADLQNYINIALANIHAAREKTQDEISHASNILRNLTERDLYRPESSCSASLSETEIINQSLSARKGSCFSADEEVSDINFGRNYIVADNPKQFRSQSERSSKPVRIISHHKPLKDRTEVIYEGGQGQSLMTRHRNISIGSKSDISETSERLERMSTPGLAENVHYHRATSHPPVSELDKLSQIINYLFTAMPGKENFEVDAEKAFKRRKLRTPKVSRSNPSNKIIKDVAMFKRGIKPHDPREGELLREEIETEEVILKIRYPKVLYSPKDDKLFRDIKNHRITRIQDLDPQKGMFEPIEADERDFRK